MIYPLSRLSGVLYVRVAKPILFKFKPDDVHEHMLKTAILCQRSRIIRSLIRSAWAYSDKPMLSQTLAGIEYDNPVGLSAGFDKNIQLLPILYSIGFGQTEVGSITALPCAGNPRPWFHRLPRTKSLVVHAGLGNHGAAAILPRVQKQLANLQTRSVLNISVAKTNCPETATESAGIADYVNGLRAVKDSGVADVITINISCPNAYGGEPFTTPDSLDALLAETDKLDLSSPLYLKMPIDLPWEKFRPLLEIADKHRVTGLTIGNLAKDRTKMKLKDPLPDTVLGNMGGKPTWELSNDLIKRTRQSYPDRFVIIGVGGINSAQDAYTKIRLGADMIELVTGLIFEGPQVIGQINRELAALLKRDGYTNIGQAVGADLRTA